MLFIFPKDQLSNEPTQSTTTPKEPIQTSQSTETAQASNQNFPPHERISLPALSPTMTTGTIVA